MPIGAVSGYWISLSEKAFLLAGLELTFPVARGLQLVDRDPG
jgi:hypothetical protein